MNNPETDVEFRDRILRVAAEADWSAIAAARERALDVFGRKYGRFRHGTSLQVTCSSNEDRTDQIGLMPSNGRRK